MMGRVVIGALLALLLVTRPILAAGLPANISNTVSTVVEKKMLSLGYAAEDPRFLSTLSGMTSTAVGAAAGAGTALMVSGAAATVTAPAWLTVAAMAGVSALVGTAVTLGVNSLWNWAFGDPTSAAPIVLNGPMGSGPSGYPASTAILTQNAEIGADGLVRAASTVVGGTAYCTQYDWCSGDPWGAIAGETGHPNPNSVRPCNGTSCRLYMCNATQCYSQQLDKDGVWRTLYVMNISKRTATVSCPPGYYYKEGYANKPESCTPVPGMVQTGVSGSYSLADAVRLLPDAELDQEVNPQVISALADALWQRASSLPGYQGVPYPVSNPVTTGDAAAVHQDGSWPTVRDLTTGTSDFTVPVTTVPGGTTIPTVPPTNPTVNLGPDPGIGSPSLETVPTMAQILGPILSLLPDVRAFQVPGHQGVCPAPSFTAFSRTFTIDAHCTLIEQQRGVIAGFMVVVWMLVGLMIVLSA